MKKWLFSTNYKNNGTLYFTFGIWSGIVGTVLRSLIRIELGISGSSIVDDQIYNVIVTAHAFIINFSWLCPL